MIMNYKSKDLELFASKLEAAQIAFDREVSDLGEQIRQSIIIPVCKRHSLEFTSGMGRYFFTTKTNVNINELDYEGTKWEKILKPIFDLLNKEVSHNQYLGYFVSDVTKEDLDKC